MCCCNINATGQERHYKTARHQNKLRDTIRNKYQQITEDLERTKRDETETVDTNKVDIVEFVCPVCDCGVGVAGEERHYKTTEHQHNLRDTIIYDNFQFAEGLIKPVEI